MTKKILPSVANLIQSRHAQAEKDLIESRNVIEHSVAKGDEGERIWIDLLNRYLPERYCARRAFVIDSESNYSDQIDIVVHDTFYTPFVFCFGGYEIVPAESVYAVFEVKQTISRRHLQYASDKINTVRNLVRQYQPTNQVANVTGNHIIGGLLATCADNAWTKREKVIGFMQSDAGETLDIVCSKDGLLVKNHGDEMRFDEYLKSPIGLLPMRLAHMMQKIGTVPPIKLTSYFPPED